ncbi:MAG: hypothetical protein EXX96DRAFT_606687 [Benjaminiella poitrasii]|nr:MAG: hypothetical protein EXX96DRAFT_606687 [Benjaminiella poitrasii]
MVNCRNKKRKIPKQKVTFNNPINNDIVSIIINSKMLFTNVTSSSKCDSTLDGKNDLTSSFLDTKYLGQLSSFHPNLEANNIIRSGKGISSKPYLGRSLYDKRMEPRSIQEVNEMPKVFHKHIGGYIDFLGFHLI